MVTDGPLPTTSAMPVTAITSLTVKSFRGIRDLNLSGCGGVNLLVGGNNSGKTSVLEAVLLHSSPFDIAQWEAAVELRRAWPLVDLRFRSDPLDRIDALTWLFPRHQGKQESIEISAVREGVEHSLNATAERIVGTPPERFISTPNELIEGRVAYRSQAELFERDPLPVQGLVIEMKAVDEAPQSLFGPESESYRMVLWEGGKGFRPRVPLRSSDKKVVFATPISHRSDGYLASRFGRVIRAKRKEEAINLMRALDDRIRDVVIVSPEEPEDPDAGLPRQGRQATLHVDHEAAGLVPIHVLGDGTRRALHLATLLIEAGENGTLLVDEIEAGMHAEVLRDVFVWLGKACREMGVQLFATTHSLEAVDAILSAVPDEELVLFRLKNEEARRYGGSILRTARMDLGQEVR